MFNSEDSYPHTRQERHLDQRVRELAEEVRRLRSRTFLCCSGNHRALVIADDATQAHEMAALLAVNQQAEWAETNDEPLSEWEFAQRLKEELPAWTVQAVDVSGAPRVFATWWWMGDTTP